MSTSNQYKKPIEIGSEKIAWAKRSMPILSDIFHQLTASGVLKDKAIGVSMDLDAKAANLILRLQNLDAKVFVFISARQAHDEIIAALESADVTIIMEGDEAPQSLDFILDDEGLFTAKAQSGALKTPVINLADSQINRMFNNHYGIGQTAIMAMLDVTNLQIAGRHITVTSYDDIGKGLAHHAAAMGAQVITVEQDPILALQAQFDGHHICDLKTACEKSDVIFASSNLLTDKHIEFVKDGVILCAAIDDADLPITHLKEIAEGKNIRGFVDEYQVSANKRILIIADGKPIQSVTGEGVSIEIADLMMSLYLKASEELLQKTDETKSGIYGVSLKTEQLIAKKYMAISNAHGKE